MNKTLNVRPGDGFTVRNPETGKELPPRSSKVPNNEYWQRQLRAGLIIDTDVEKVELGERARLQAEAEERAKDPAIDGDGDGDGKKGDDK